MKNKAIDFHNIMFEQLERLNDTEEVIGDKLTEEIRRAEAMAKIAAQITANNNMVLNAMRTANDIGIEILPDMLAGTSEPLMLPKPAKRK